MGGPRRKLEPLGTSWPPGWLLLDVAKSHGASPHLLMARAETRPPALREPHSQSWGRLELDRMGRCRSRCLFVMPMTETSVSVGSRPATAPGNFLTELLHPKLRGYQKSGHTLRVLRLHGWLAVVLGALHAPMPTRRLDRNDLQQPDCDGGSSGTAYAAAVTTSAGKGLDLDRRSLLRSRTLPLWCLTNGWFCDHAYACHQCYPRIHIRNVHPPP